MAANIHHTPAPEKAREVLQKILDDPREVRYKTVIQTEALNIGAKMLHQAYGERRHHEICILQYHAVNREATIFREERTLKAIKEAVKVIDADIARRRGGEHE